MTFLVRGTMKPSMSLLYAGLDPVRAGEVITELDSLGVPYEIKGEAIFIPANIRDKTRFSLARDGLPRQSVQGYELLDSVNGFSVTSEMYNAAYWRAKEGRLLGRSQSDVGRGAPPAPVRERRTQSLSAGKEIL